MKYLVILALLLGTYTSFASESKEAGNDWAEVQLIYRTAIRDAVHEKLLDMVTDVRITFDTRNNLAALSDNAAARLTGDPTFKYVYVSAIIDLEVSPGFGCRRISLKVDIEDIKKVKEVELTDCSRFN